MILVKSPQEIEVMRRAGRVVGRFFEEVRRLILPGVSTWDLEDFADRFIARNGVRSAFKGYMGYPAHLCVSINEEVVHGIPSKDRIVREGDILSIDFGVVREGFYGDSAMTFPVGAVNGVSSRLLAATERSLAAGIGKVRPGNRLGDVSAAVQETVESEGFSVVRDFVGHGIGRSLHEDPQIPNFGKPGVGPKLMPGMTLAIEPMVNAGGWSVEVLADGWTVVTRDRSRSAHFEHTVAVTEDGCQILSLA
ncbi:MAG TPA: type I methionyl aminopeptidase [Candidatus Deferrimicrobium sp.]|nr:type I methionyl aminopeptidase [Candidatus Deferrimicrobium sp.]